MSRSNAADQFYSRWATLYDLVSRRTPGVGALRSTMIGRLNLDSGMTVLDMGCGPGPNFAALRQAVGANGQVVGIDVARGALGRAQAHVQRAGWTNVHVVRADATTPPVRDANAIVATFVIGMFDDPAEIVDAWCKRVGPGGRVGLLHFANSDRWYAPLPNTVLRGIVLISTPGHQRLHTEATQLLDRRVRRGHDALKHRCDAYEYSTHFGGIVHIFTGTVAKAST